MIQIESEPMVKTVNIIPTTIPSNKSTHSLIRNRERHHLQSAIYRENEVTFFFTQKIYDKIESAASLYRKQGLDNEWR